MNICPHCIALVLVSALPAVALLRGTVNKKVKLDAYRRKL